MIRTNKTTLPKIIILYKKLEDILEGNIMKVENVIYCVISSLDFHLILRSHNQNVPRINVQMKLMNEYKPHNI